MNKILGTALGLGMILAAAAPSFAATNVTMNNTGPYSKNRVRIERGITTKVNNIQGALVVNKIKNENNTGGNSATLNTNVTGTGGTGNATSNTTVDNNINTALTVIDGCGCPEEDTDVSLSNTGPYSKNKVYINDSTTTTVNNVQIGVVWNKIKSNNNTGGNSATLNTNVSGVNSTGNASSDVAVTNNVNYSETWIGATPP